MSRCNFSILCIFTRISKYSQYETHYCYPYFLFDNKSRQCSNNIHRSPFTIYLSSFTVYHLPFIVYRLPFTVHHSAYPRSDKTQKPTSLLQTISGRSFHPPKGILLQRYSGSAVDPLPWAGLYCSAQKLPFSSRPFCGRMAE